MNPAIEELTPRQIVAELDRYIIGQGAAKKAVAVALRNRYRRQQLPPQEREDVLPKNILMIGPTGVGKTEIARRLAQLARAPFIKVEATKFTEVGYVGRDVESMIRDLVGASVRLVEKEKTEEVRPEAERRALERLLQLVDRGGPESTGKSRKSKVSPELMQKAIEAFGARYDSAFEGPPDEEALEEARSLARRYSQRRKKLEKDLALGKLDDLTIEVEIEEASNPFIQVFTPQGMEEMGLDSHPGAGPFQQRRTRRKVKVSEAKQILVEEEAKKLLDRPALNREAIQRAEQTGIVFLDELDKIAGKSGGAGPDVSREGVQRDLLPIIEGSTVATKFGPVRTDHVLFIAAGAFHMAKPSELIPELQGRLPIRVELEALSETDFRRILREPKNALTKQYEKLLKTDGVTITFTDSALDEIAKLASEVNAKTENIGARRLHTMMEKLLEDLLFEAPETDRKSVSFDDQMVREALSGLVADVDLSRYIL